MVLLRVKGRFMVPIALEKLEDPAMEGFRTLRIDRDHWSDVFEDGLTQRAFERVIAVFPQRSGRLVVPPFVHHLTVVEPSMKQRKVDLASAPVALDVVPAPAAGNDWWIAAADLAISETWSKDPEALDIGQSTRRTITIAAKGVFDDQLPPPPTVKADGLIVFPGNATRATRVGLGRAEEKFLSLREQALRRKGRLEEVATTFAGPLAEVSYTYDIRPATGSAVVLPAIRIPWFDTASRSLRMAVLPERTVALRQAATDVGRLEAALGIAAEATPGRNSGHGGTAVTILAALVTMAVGFWAGVAALKPALVGAARDGLRRWQRLRRLRRRVRDAARRNHAGGVRSALVFLAAEDAGQRRDHALAALAAVDRHLFAGRADRAADLVGLTSRVV